MEQVLRTVNALNEAGFVGAFSNEYRPSSMADLYKKRISDITMYETLIRPHEVSQVPTLVSITEVSEKLKQAEQKREGKRLRQIANSRNIVGKRKRVENADDEVLESGQDTGNKRAKADDEQGGSQIPSTLDLPGSAQDPDISEAPSSVEKITIEKQIPEEKFNASKIIPEVRGHTSYLTFACLIPPMSTETDDSEDLIEVDEV